MLKSDLKTQKSPSLWRIDNKQLLQKYEPISYHDETAYRNTITVRCFVPYKKSLY